VFKLYTGFSRKQHKMIEELAEKEGVINIKVD